MPNLLRSPLNILKGCQLRSGWFSASSACSVSESLQMTAAPVASVNTCDQETMWEMNGNIWGGKCRITISNPDTWYFIMLCYQHRRCSALSIGAFRHLSLFIYNKLAKLGDAIAISKSETIRHSLTHSTLLYHVSLLSGCWDRWSLQKLKYQYRDHIVGQLTRAGGSKAVWNFSKKNIRFGSLRLPLSWKHSHSQRPCKGNHHEEDGESFLWNIQRPSLCSPTPEKHLTINH